MSSKHSEPNKKKTKNLILITHQVLPKNTDLDNPKTFLTYENGDCSFRYNMSRNAKKMNSTIISKTINYIKKTYEKDYIDSTSSNPKTPIHHKGKLSPKHLYNIGEGELSERTVLEEEKKKNHNETEIEPNILKLSTNSFNSKNQKNDLKLNIDFKSRNIANKIQIIPPSSISIYQKCLICNKGFSKHSMINTKNCDHFLCRRCAKNYYEEKIEQGLSLLKCPVMPCCCYYEVTMMNYIISDNHYKLLLNEDRKSMYSKSKYNENNSNSYLFENNIFANTQVKNIKIYNQKHVIDINSNETFYKYKRTKAEFCPKCNEKALFGKSGAHFVKCLNCFYTMCKYCMKEFKESHLNINSPDHCKVFYRLDKEIKLSAKHNCFINFLLQIFLVIVSYLILFGGLYKTLKNNIFHKFIIQKTNFWIRLLRKMIIFILNFIIFLLFSPLLLLILPYFPVFISIFG